MKGKITIEYEDGTKKILNKGLVVSFNAEVTNVIQNKEGDSITFDMIDLQKFDLCRAGLSFAHVIDKEGLMESFGKLAECYGNLEEYSTK